MANEVVTRVSVDASGFEAGMERTKRAANGFVASQQASASKYEACQQQLAASSALTARALEEAVKVGSAATARQVSTAVKGFEKIADTAGKTRFDLMRLKAANLGIAESAEPLIAKAEAASRAMHHLGAGSVAARRELFVLGHEAMQGSWKNFVGSLMVLAERIDVLPLLCGPAGIALGALGASAFATYHAIHGLNEQQEKLDRAMVLTGNYAALTQGELLAYSDTISRHVGASASDARQALLELARSGRVAGADLAQVAESVAAYAKVSGQTVEEVTKQFEQSYDHASDGARKWAETHHDLTKATIDQIQAMEQSGDKAGAWAKFVEAASAAALKAVIPANRVMAESYETLGDRWDRFWRTIAGKGDELTKLQDEIAAKRSTLYDTDANPFGTNTEAIEKDIAALERRKQAIMDQRALTKKDTRASNVFQSMMTHHDEDMKAVRTWKEKLDDANASARAAKDAILGAAKAAGHGREELKTLREQLNADLKKTIAHNETMYHPPKAKREEPDKAARYLEHLREQGAALQAQLTTTDKLTNAQKELSQFNERIAAARQHVASAQDLNLLRAEKAIRAQLEQNVALEKANKLREAQEKLKERVQHTQESVGQFQQAQRDRYGQTLGDRGLDPRRRDEQIDARGIEHHYQRELDELRKNTPVALLGGEEYRKAVSDIRERLAESVALHTDYFAAVERLQKDWRVGAKRGIAEFFKDTQDKAETARHAVVEVMGRMEDAVAKFVTTGKLHMKAFVASALADLARVAMRQALAGVAGAFLPSLVFAGHARGGSIAGPGTSTSDSIPAMLSNGEYVVNAASARQHHALLEAINSNHLAHFASGGPVGKSVGAMARLDQAQVNLEVHNHGGGALSDRDARELEQLVSAFVDQKIARKMGGQGGLASLISQGHFG